MLNYTKKYINFLALSITIFIFIVFIILDVSKLKKYERYKNREEISNIVDIQNVYIEISKRVNENILDKEEVVAEEEKQIEKVSKINIYSTNPWRIKIPKIDLDAPITEGTTQEDLRRTVGHFEQTDKWYGNVALAGHNRGYRCNFFQEIYKLQKGDIIIYSTEKGERRYQVIINTVIKETDWTYIEDTEDNRITLITCETGKREYRRCIQAVEV